MLVTRYQMHNVLECYGKKLSRARGVEKTANGPPKGCAGEMTLSPETSRRAAMDKISRQVLNKVAEVAGLSSIAETGRPCVHGEADDAASAGNPAPVEFAYHAVDAIDRRRTARLAMGGPGG